MDLTDVEWLDGPTGRQVLATLPAYRAEEAIAVSLRLRGQGLDPSEAAAALTQSRLKSAVARRWGQGYDDLVASLLFTPRGAEQATRPVVAALRADRFAALGPGARVADLGCGLGVDTLALLARDLAVDAFEVDQVTAAVAAANVRRSPGGTVRRADVTAVAPQTWTRYDAVFVDPARRGSGQRSGAGRIGDPERWSPPLSWVLALEVAHLAVKVAPGLAHAAVPEGTEFATVSVGGDVVEAGLYRGALRSSGVRRSATVVRPTFTSWGARTSGPAPVTLTDGDLPDAPVPARPLGRYLHEPDGAVIRAGLVGAVAAGLDAWLIDPDIAYLSSDRAAPPEVVTSGLVSSYRVTAAMPFSLKTLRAHLRAEGVGHVVVKKRGSAVDVDRLRASLRLDPAQPGRRVVVLTRVGAAPLAVVTEALTGLTRGAVELSRPARTWSRGPNGRRTAIRPAKAPRPAPE